MKNIWLEPAVKTYKQYFGDIATTIIDVGTRDGDDAEFFRKKLKSKKIYVIDANPIAIEETKNKYPNFNIFETAISNYNGVTNFVQIISDNKDHAGSSSIENYSFFEEAKYNTIEVPVITMSKFLENNNLKDKLIDIIKVDIEGYTYEFLEGFEGDLDNVKMLHLETETFERQENHKNNNEIINFMTNSGFLLAGVSYEWGPRIQDQVWINPNHINSYWDGSGNMSLRTSS
jgi:FkbM family methyltransferase